MKAILNSLAAFLFTSVALGQNQVTDTSATCVAYWTKGETKVYTITRTREKTLSSGATTTSTVSFDAHLKVKDSTLEGYTIEWTQKNYQIKGGDKNTTDMLNAMMQGLPIIYKTDDVGSFKELINWKEMRDFYFGMMEPFINKDNKDAVATLNQVKAMFETKENVETVLIREIQVFHMPYGAEYTRRGQHTSTLLPNIMGGEPFPATLSLTLTKLEPEQDACTITVNQSLDKKVGRQVLIDLLKKIAPQEDVNGEIEKGIQDLALSDLTNYDLTLSTGWLRRVSLQRVANVGPSSQVETYTIIEKR